MGKRRIRSHLIGILLAMAILVMLNAVCGSFRLIWTSPINEILFGGSRSGYVFKPPLLNSPRFVLNYNNSYRDSGAHLYARAGQSIVADYQLTIERGSMALWIYGPKNWFQRFIYSGGFSYLDGPVYRTIFDTSGNGRIVVPIQADGYYAASINGYRLTGHVDIQFSVQ